MEKVGGYGESIREYESRGEFLEKALENIEKILWGMEKI